MFHVAIQQTRFAFLPNKEINKEELTKSQAGKAEPPRFLASRGSPYLRHSPQCNYKITRHMLLQHLDPPCKHRDPYRTRKPLIFVRNGWDSPHSMAPTDPSPGTASRDRQCLEFIFVHTGPKINCVVGKVNADHQLRSKKHDIYFVLL